VTTGAQQDTAPRSATAAIGVVAPSAVPASSTVRWRGAAPLGSDDDGDGRRDVVGLTRRGRATKRAFDLLVGTLVLLAALPVIAVLALLVVLETSGSPLFAQRRVGRHGATFTVWKLRTMHRDAEQRLAADEALRARYIANGFKLEAGADPRVTRVGRFLRRTSLDELPQLVNVVAGSMSLVGPRPVVPEELTLLYGHHVRSYCSVRPGLTGLWQVAGRSRVRGADRVELDLRYLREAGVRADLGILWRTVPAVLSQRGAH
jgi:exopolysaccharide production protein ExoY